MAKQSVLDMVQNILSAIDSDPVSDIDETVESVQVAELLREAYYDLMSQREWPFLHVRTTLDALGDLANPTTMRMPDNLNKVFWLKYNKKEVVYVPPQEFQHMLDIRVAQPNVVNSAGFIINRDPEYWTSFDDKNVVFDAYTIATEDTLQGSKSLVYGLKVAEWTQANTFIPDMPEKFFPTLLAEAKSAAFMNLKQLPNQKEERKAQRGRVMLRNEVWRNEAGEIKYNTKVNYGRRGSPSTRRK
jgi:hypothetical protein